MKTSDFINSQKVCLPFPLKPLVGSPQEKHEYLARYYICPLYAPHINHTSLYTSNTYVLLAYNDILMYLLQYIAKTSKCISIRRSFYNFWSIAVFRDVWCMLNICEFESASSAVHSKLGTTSPLIDPLCTRSLLHLFP